MDVLLQNVEGYIKILQSCRTTEVAQWKTTDLERALKWSEHFQNVYKKLQMAKPHLLKEFTERLQRQCQDITVNFGHEEIGIEFLGRSREYLIKSLIENPSLDSELRDYLIKHDNTVLDVHYMKSLSENDKILHSLMTITSTLLSSPTLLSVIKGDIIVNAIAIMEELKLALTRHTSSPNKSNQSLIKEHLSSLTQDKEGMEVVLTCLLPLWIPEVEGSQSSDTIPETDLQKIILSWFQDYIERDIDNDSPCSRHQTLFTISPQLLAYISSFSSPFLEFYISQLTILTDIYSNNPHSTGTSNCDALFDCWLTLSHASLITNQTCMTVVKKRSMSTGVAMETIWTKLLRKLTT